jgi:hypothetical protein
VQFVRYSENLRVTIANSLEFENFDHLKYNNYTPEERLEHIFQDKMNRLKKYKKDDGVLIVVDGFDKSYDDDLTEFISGEYKVIFTTRKNPQGQNSLDKCGNVLDVKPMAGDDLHLLFDAYYGTVETAPLLSDNERFILSDVFKYVDNHTMTISLIAVTMAKRTSAQVVLERLKKGLGSEFDRKAFVDKEGISAAELKVYEHIQVLFDMNDMSDNERFVMTNMAIIPREGLEFERFCEWVFGENYNDDVQNLVNSHWIQHDNYGYNRKCSCSFAESGCYREKRKKTQLCQ